MDARGLLDHPEAGTPPMALPAVHAATTLYNVPYGHASGHDLLLDLYLPATDGPVGLGSDRSSFFSTAAAGAYTINPKRSWWPHSSVKPATHSPA